MRHARSGRRGRTNGQTMPEYVILAAFIIMGLALVMGLFPSVLNHFCYVVLHVICGPL